MQYQCLNCVICWMCVLLIVAVWFSVGRHMRHIIIMKNFNRHSSHGHHGWKRHQQAHSHGLHAFTHTLTSTQLQPDCEKRQLSYYRIWNDILFESTWGRGSKPKYPEKTTKSLAANRYHIFREENPTSQAGIKPSPSDIGDKSSLGKECTLRMTHRATDCYNYFIIIII